MDAAKTGGPAFPYFDPDGGTASEGMTLRDYLAAAALTGLLSNPKLAQKCVDAGGAESGWFEAQAVAFADGLLKELGE